MIKQSVQTFLVAIVIAVFAQSAPAANHDGKDTEGVLVILSDSSLQTRGMAMVLANAMQSQGKAVTVLLCDSAGELAVDGFESEKLQPRNVSPEMLLQKLMENGASVAVCALYLPNSDYTEADLLKGVSVATPPAMAEMMTGPSMRVFTF